VPELGGVQLAIGHLDRRLHVCNCRNGVLAG
jgi:hypothetical protein